MKLIDRFQIFVQLNFFYLILLEFLSFMSLIFQSKDGFLFKIPLFITVLFFLWWNWKMFKNWLTKKSLANFLLKSPFNLVLGSLGSGKTAFLVYVSFLMEDLRKKDKFTTFSSFPFKEKNILSLGHMSLLDNNYQILPKKSLLLLDESNFFIEGVDDKQNKLMNKTQGIQEYFALARHFGHLVLVSGQRPEHIWASLRNISNSVIYPVKVKSINIFRPFLTVTYGTFRDVSEYEKYRDGMIAAQQFKDGKRSKYRNIPQLDIFFFEIKIPLFFLNQYSSNYFSWLREYKNADIKEKNMVWDEVAIDLVKLDFLKMEKFSSFFKKFQKKEKK